MDRKKGELATTANSVERVVLKSATSPSGMTTELMYGRRSRLAR